MTEDNQHMDQERERYLTFPQPYLHLSSSQRRLRGMN